MRVFFIRSLALFFILISVLSLASCTQEINTPSDELKRYRWVCEEENGTCVELSFDATDAFLNIDNDAYTLDIGGLCYADDDSLSICDKSIGCNYTFGYQLYGDRVELRFNSGTLSLQKAETQQ